jgi:hypothetical protein
MLGYGFSVYKQKNGGASPAGSGTSHRDQGPRIATWQTGLFGLDWVRKLVEEGKAIQTGWNGGYPFQYTAPTKHIIPTILAGPPRANATWSCGGKDAVASWWAGKTVIDRPLAEACGPEEWLLVEAWDES